MRKVLEVRRLVTQHLITANSTTNPCDGAWIVCISLTTAFSRRIAFLNGRPELGSLKPGSVGDATLISVKQGQFDYEDVVGEHLIGDRKIVSEGVVIGGRWWHPK